MWYLKKGGVRSGPFTDAQIRERLNLGIAGPLDCISSDGQHWQTVRDSEFWKQERTIPDPHAARAGRKISLASGGAPSITTIPPSNTPSRPGSPDMSSPSAPVAQAPSRPRFHNWWLAVAIPCATAVILAVIGLFMPDSPDGAATGTPAEAGGGAAADDGYRGEEIGSLNIEYFKPEYQDFCRYICPTYGEMKQTFAMIAASEHVDGNLQYQDALSQVHFYVETSNNIVNAYATIVDPYREQLWPTMIVQGGLGRFSRIVGAVLTEYGDDEKLGDALGEMLIALGNSPEIALESTAGFLCDDLKIPLSKFSDEAWVANAKNISRGILLSVLAHEAGHLALGHVWSWEKNLERSRNQEREADSFAHSVASGTADAENMFWGNFIFHYAYALFEGKDPDSEIARTHPFAEERLCNLIRDNQSMARKCGFTEEDVKKHLAEVRESMRE